jgi:transposase
MREAIHHALAHWKELTQYAGNGFVDIDNNGVENAIRPTALGKKNWLFIARP